MSDAGKTIVRASAIPNTAHVSCSLWRQRHVGFQVLNSLKNWDHGSAPLQPQQVHFCTSLKHASIIRNASTVQARIPKLLNTAQWLASGDIRDTSTQIWACEISSLRGAVDENCALLGYYARCSDHSLPMFWDRSWILDLWRWNPIGCPRQSVRNCHYKLRHSPKERCSILTWSEFMDPALHEILFLKIQLVSNTQSTKRIS
jgi:hypothetical protein